jgi:predicted SprT family Zn-dependent metalloprotease
VKIPESFKQFAQEVTVKYKKDLSNKHGSWGKCYYDRNEIELQDNKYDEGLPDIKLEETFYHELVHIILYFAGEQELRNNEKFVDVFSGLLHQALTTAVYEEKK